MKRIKHNDLLPWFTGDHGQLPAAYLRKCRKFLNSIQHMLITKKDAAFLFRHRAASYKQQATSSPQLNVLTTKEYKKLERKYKNENK